MLTTISESVLTLATARIVAEEIGELRGSHRGSLFIMFLSVVLLRSEKTPIPFSLYVRSSVRDYQVTQLRLVCDGVVLASTRRRIRRRMRRFKISQACKPGRWVFGAKLDQGAVAQTHPSASNQRARLRRQLTLSLTVRAELGHSRPVPFRRMEVELGERTQIDLGTTPHTSSTGSESWGMTSEQSSLPLRSQREPLSFCTNSNPARSIRTRTRRNALLSNTILLYGQEKETNRAIGYHR